MREKDVGSVEELGMKLYVRRRRRMPGENVTGGARAKCEGEEGREGKKREERRGEERRGEGCGMPMLEMVCAGGRCKFVGFSIFCEQSPAQVLFVWEKFTNFVVPSGLCRLVDILTRKV